MKIAHLIKLYCRLGRRYLTAISLTFIACLGYLTFFPDDPASVGVRSFAIIVGLAFVLTALGISLKVRRALLAVRSGVHREAVVLGLEPHGYSDDDEPQRFVLTWKDSDGHWGSSLPGSGSTFDAHEPGDQIRIYRNGPQDSWWERDLFGSVER